MNEYKKGDRVKATVFSFPCYDWGVGIITEIEDRENGCITVKFDNGQTGLLFKNEIRKVKEEANK